MSSGSCRSRKSHRRRRRRYATAGREVGPSDCPVGGWMTLGQLSRATLPPACGRAGNVSSSSNCMISSIGFRRWRGTLLGLGVPSGQVYGHALRQTTKRDYLPASALVAIMVREYPANAVLWSALGEVPEWPIGPVSKTGVGAILPRVRIPPSPFFLHASVTQALFRE